MDKVLHGDLLTTGASSVTEKYHIFDIAGNLMEWTEEASYSTNTNQYRIQRGSTCINNSNAYPSISRNRQHDVEKTWSFVGFRVVLYIK